MTFLFVLLIVVACVFLGLIILIQNPKGGGLASNVGGFSNQLMGVKQTTDVLEKGTWVLAAVVGLLCLFSAVFIPKAGSAKEALPQNVSAPAGNQPQQPGAVPFGSAAPAKKTP
jgi:preprotein translocase subunit SecG